MVEASYTVLHHLHPASNNTVSVEAVVPHPISNPIFNLHSNLSPMSTANPDPYFNPSLLSKITTQGATTTLITLPSSITFTTNPDTPSELSLINITTHSATLQWLPPRHIAVGSVVESYLVRYTVANHLGDFTVRGSTMTMKCYNVSCRLGDLVQGTTYAVDVKVIFLIAKKGFVFLVW